MDLNQLHTGKKSMFPEINCHWKLSLTSVSAIFIEVSCDLSQETCMFSKDLLGV